MICIAKGQTPFMTAFASAGFMKYLTETETRILNKQGFVWQILRNAS
jgi:hypothetical protein